MFLSLDCIFAFILCPLSSNPITSSNIEAFSFLFFSQKRDLVCGKDSHVAAILSLQGVGSNLVCACHHSLILLLFGFLHI